MTYAHLRGTDECKLAKDKDVTCKMSFETDCIGRQSAIEEIARWIGYLDEDMIFRIQTGLKKLPSVQRWIPVSERLPELNNVYKKDVLPYYLVQNEYGDMMVATFIKSNGEARVWQQIYQYGEIMDEIVAWMPLPEPWKGEEDEQRRSD